MMSHLYVTNPFDAAPVGKVKLSSESEVEAALAIAEKTHRNNKKGLPKYERAAILKKAAEIMKGRANELALLIASEGGKPLIDAKVEVERAIDGVETCASEIANNSGSEVPMDLTPAGKGKMAFTIKEPIGPVVAISAFNHPLNLIVHQVGPAVAAGNPVIVKPADDTPLCCEAFIKILHQAGLAPEWAQFICCDVSVAQKLVTDERVAFFSFIGSSAVGWKLRSLLAPGTRVALEHGGVAPVIVCPSAKKDQLVPSLVKGGFYHSGQVCVSVQRVFCVNSSGKELADSIADQASKLVVGNAIEAETQCGPLIRNREVDRVEDWVAEAVAAGAQGGGARAGCTSRGDRRCVHGANAGVTGCREGQEKEAGQEHVKTTYEESCGPWEESEQRQGLCGSGGSCPCQEVCRGYSLLGVLSWRTGAARACSINY